MKLSFKKSVLLFTTVALGGMLGASAQDLVLEGYENAYTFEQEWKSDAVPKTNGSNPWSNYRQGFGQDNQFYIQSKGGNGTVMIYNKDGKVRDFYTNSGKGSNFTKDEAGNLLVRTRPYQDPYYNPNTFEPDLDDREDIRIIKADGSASALIELAADCPGTRGDYWGFAQGDVFSAEGGRLVFVGRNTNFLYAIDIKSGVLTKGTRIAMPYMPGANGDKLFAFEDAVSAWKDANGNQHYLVIQRTENPIDVIINDNYTATATTINIKSYSNFGTSNGTNAFAFNGKNYIMFSTQPNWNDGFVIAELGTNADGTLNGEINVVAKHVNDYPDPLPASNSPSCNWLNWEPRDEKSIYVYQYFPGYYMARYILGIKTDETTLDKIVNEGTEDVTYTIADDIQSVYIAVKEPTKVYAKDYGKHRNPSVMKDGEKDFIKTETALESKDEWDQSNWVLLDFGDADKAAAFVTNGVGKVIEGGTLTGKLTNKLNPTMTVTSYIEPTEEKAYVENNYIGCNFMTPNVQSNIFWHGSTYNFFFVEPKAQEYVKVWWALFDDGLKHFSIVTDSEAKGSFNVDWSLYPGDWKVDFIKGNAYNFHAIVRYLDENGSMIGAKGENNVVEGNYMVFPLEGGDGLITAIDAVAAADSEVQSVTYVNLLGVQSATPFAGINLVVTRYTTGETIVTKQIK